MHKKAKIISLVAIIAFIVAWSVFLLFVPPEHIVGYLGVREGYVLVFLIAILGGVSALTSSSFYAILITLAAGGLNPFLLGIVGGTGLAISDSIFFYIGIRTRDIVHKNLIGGFIDRVADRLSNWFRTKPRWFVPATAYVYTGLTPFPSDILMLALALAEIPYKRIILPIFFGSVTLATIIAWASVISTGGF